MKLISIIIPFYNRLDAFQSALSSVLNQTYKNIEIIVVDDGSEPPVQSSEFSGDTDALGVRVQKDINIKWLRQENGGAPSARNKGLEIAKGDYVIFWDADIVADTNMLQKMHDVLEEDLESSFAYCNHTFGSKKMPARKFDLEKLKQNNYIHSTSLIQKKDAIKWDESLKRFQDWDLWLTMSEDNKKGIWINEYLFDICSIGTISGWLPSFAYKKPWKYLPWIRSRVGKYEESKNVVKRKHNLK